jgi:hypothetical protein
VSPLETPSLHRGFKNLVSFSACIYISENNKNKNKNKNKNNCIYCAYFVVLVVVVASSLNGNNGSWTNTDDHDAQVANGEQGNRQNAHRRINNRVRHANPAFANGAGPNRQRAPPQPQHGVVIGGPAPGEGVRLVAAEQEKKEPLPPKIVHYAVYERGEPFSLVNELFIVRIGEEPNDPIGPESEGVDQHGVIHKLVPPDHRDRQVASIEPNGCAYTKEYTREDLNAPWVIVDHPKVVYTRYTWSEYDYKRTQLCVAFRAKLPCHMVNKTFRLFRVSGDTLESEAYRSTIRAFVFGPTYEMVPNLLKQQVVECLIAHRRRAGLTTKRLNVSDVYEVPTVTQELDLRDHLSTVLTVGVVNVRTMQFDMARLGLLTLRDDVDLVLRGCAFHYINEEQTIINPAQCRFNTLDVGKVDTYTRYFGFQGPKCFYRYDRSPNNVLGGFLKRMLSAREHDDELRSMQSVFVLRAATIIYDLDGCAGRTDEAPWGLGLPSRMKTLLRTMGIVHLAQGQGRARVNVFRKQFRDRVVDRQVVYEHNPVFDAIWRSLMRRCTVGFYNQVYDCLQNTFTAVSDNAAVWSQSMITQISPWLGDLFYSRRELSRMPHVKRALRQQMVDGILVHTPEDVLVEHPQACGKVELCKGDPTKTMRIFVSYGSGAVYANEIPEVAKLCMHGLYQGLYNGLTWYVFIHAKPKATMFQDALDLYKTVVATPDSVAISIYSDDSCLTVNCNGIVESFNMDISSCDCGNDFAIFTLVGLLMGNFSEELANGLVAQCCKPIELKNPHNPLEKVVVDFKGPFEGSGTVLTTICNHVASMCISSEIITLLGDTLANGDNFTIDSDFIKPAAARAGHKVTLERNTVLGTHSPSFQFLKHSFGMSAVGVAVPYLNYGAILRGLGSTMIPIDAVSLGLSLPEFKKLTLQERIERRTRGIINGLVNEPRSSIIDALFTRWPPLSWEGQPEREYLRSLTDGLDLSIYRITDEALCDCYGTTPEEICELVRAILTVQVGELHLLDAVGKIFQKDYGLNGEYEFEEHETPLEHVVGFDQSARYRGALSSL